MHFWKDLRLYSYEDNITEYIKQIEQKVLPSTFSVTMEPVCLTDMRGRYFRFWPSPIIKDPVIIFSGEEMWA